MTEKDKTGVGESFMGSPAENFSRGILGVEIPELGPKTKGKVRDIWTVGDSRVMVTTDRQSAYDRMICTIPGKGQVLNLLSAFWFENTQDIVQNHMIAVPHPNVLVARQAADTLPVEVVLRRYMAKSSTPTSIYFNYFERGRRETYGTEFPDGLMPNQELPMGTMLTPTTKAETGHDEELTDQEAEKIVDTKLGKGMWAQTREAALAIFERTRMDYGNKGLIFVDTKYEFGVDKNGRLMLIDEINTPDSSRLWLSATYQERLRAGQNPETFDKEILRRWLSERGFRGEGDVPVVDSSVVEQMAAAYKTPYRMVAGEDLPPDQSDSVQIKAAILQFLQK